MPQKYIVTFKENATEEQVNKAKQDVRANGGRITNEYDMGPEFRGFAAEMPDTLLSSFQSLQGDLIKSIEPDGEVRIQ